MLSNIGCWCMPWCLSCISSSNQKQIIGLHQLVVAVWMMDLWWAVIAFCAVSYGLWDWWGRFGIAQPDRRQDRLCKGGRVDCASQGAIHSKRCSTCKPQILADWWHYRSILCTPAPFEIGQIKTNACSMGWCIPAGLHCIALVTRGVLLQGTTWETVGQFSVNAWNYWEITRRFFKCARTRSDSATSYFVCSRISADVAAGLQACSRFILPDI